MVKFINKLTGTVMWVADDRKESYLASGHRIAVENPRPTKPVMPKKTATKKKR